MATTASPLAYFLRAWNISVQTSDGSTLTVSNSQDAESLRVELTIDTYMLLAYWQATISIYNLSSSTASQIQAGAPGGQNLLNAWKGLTPLNLGDTVTISAGYQNTSSGTFNSASNIIYTGKVLQSIWIRENVVDYKLTLRCVTGLLEDAFNWTSFPLAKGSTDSTALNQILSTAGIDTDNIDSGSQTALEKSQYSRGQAITGRPLNVIGEIAKQNKLFGWLSYKGLNLRSFDPLPDATPKYIFGPPNQPNTGSNSTTGTVTPTLIGVPQQTQDGVQFRVLLDSRVNIGDIVEIQPGTLINAAPVQIGQLPPAPSQNGIYVVAGVRHVGDTRGRGDDWYTEITGVVMDFFANFLQSRTPGK